MGEQTMYTLNKKLVHSNNFQTQVLGSERERLNRMSRNYKNKGGGGVIIIFT